MNAKENKRYSPNEITLINGHNAIFDEPLLRESMNYLNMDFPQKRVFIAISSTGYPEIRFANSYIKLHRIIGQYVFKDKEGVYQYHHIDGNKLNSSAKNLQQMTLSEHQKLHGTGRIISEKHRLAISRARKGKIPWNVRAILMLDKNNNIISEFASTKVAAETIGVCKTAITNNLNNRSKYCNNCKFVYKDEYIS